MNYSDLKKYPYKTKLLSSEKDSLVIIKFPDFKNCFSKGKNLEEAIKNGYKKLNKRIKSMQKRNLPIPLPNSYLKRRKNILSLNISEKLNSELKTKAKTENIDSETLAITLIAEGLALNKNASNNKKSKKIKSYSNSELDSFTTKLLYSSIGFSLFASVTAGIYYAYSSIINGSNLVISIAGTIAVSAFAFILLLSYFICIIVLTSMCKSTSDFFKEEGFSKIAFVDKAAPYIATITLFFSLIALIYTGYTCASRGNSLLYTCFESLISSLIASILFFGFNFIICCFIDPIIEVIQNTFSTNKKYRKPPLIIRP